MTPVMSFFATIFPVIILWSSVPGTSGQAEFISPEDAARQITECGTGAVDIRYDDLLQSHILTVHDAAEGQLQCIERAAGYYDVELPPEFQKRFSEIRTAKYSAVYREQAVALLSKRGLLNKVSQYRAGETSDATFARELEAICGPAAEGALQSRYGPRTISPEWVKKMPLPFRPQDAEAMSCLMAAASVAGWDLGIIGNEAFPE